MGKDNTTIIIYFYENYLLVKNIDENLSYPRLDINNPVQFIKEQCDTDIKVQEHKKETWDSHISQFTCINEIQCTDIISVETNLNLFNEIKDNQNFNKIALEDILSNNIVITDWYATKVILDYDIRNKYNRIETNNRLEIIKKNEDSYNEYKELLKLGVSYNDKDIITRVVNLRKNRITRSCITVVKKFMDKLKNDDLFLDEVYELALRNLQNIYKIDSDIDTYFKDNGKKYIKQLIQNELASKDAVLEYALNNYSDERTSLILKSYVMGNEKSVEHIFEFLYYHINDGRVQELKFIL